MYLSFDLHPMSISHGFVLQISNQWHGTFELIDTAFRVIYNLPVFVLCNTDSVFEFIITEGISSLPMNDDLHETGISDCNRVTIYPNGEIWTLPACSRALSQITMLNNVLFTLIPCISLKKLPPPLSPIVLRVAGHFSKFLFVRPTFYYNLF